MCVCVCVCKGGGVVCESPGCACSVPAACVGPGRGELGWRGAAEGELNTKTQTSTASEI